MKYGAGRRHAEGPINIVIVDRSDLLAGGVARLLSPEDGDRGEEKDEAVRSALTALSPDVVLVRVSTSGPGTLELADRIAAAVPEANVIALAGASAEVAPGETAASARSAAEGSAGGGVPTPRQRSLDLDLDVPSTSQEPEAGAGVQKSPLAKLTPREKEILGLLADGVGGGHIARKLSLSPNTVRSHIQNIRAKLKVHSRLEAVTLAIRHGIRRSPPE